MELVEDFAYEDKNFRNLLRFRACCIHSSSIFPFFCSIFSFFIFSSVHCYFSFFHVFLFFSFFPFIFHVFSLFLFPFFIK